MDAPASVKMSKDGSVGFLEIILSRTHRDNGIAGQDGGLGSSQRGG